MFGPDERGSVISLTDSAGALIALNRYDEYGRPQSGNTGRFGYTGQQHMGELSMTGQPHAFYYYKAPIYRPTSADSCRPTRLGMTVERTSMLTCWTIRSM